MSKPPAHPPRRVLGRTREAVVVVADLGGAVGALSMAGAAIAGVAGVVVGAARQEPALVTIGIGLTSGMVFAVAVVPLFLLRATSPFASNRGYRWRTARYRYSVDPADPHRHVQTVEIEIVALRNGVDTFYNQYMWSGAGEDKGPQVVSEGHQLLGQVKRQRAWWCTYLVEIEPTL